MTTREWIRQSRAFLPCMFIVVVITSSLITHMIMSIYLVSSCHIPQVVRNPLVESPQRRLLLCETLSKEWRLSL